MARRQRAYHEDALGDTSYEDAPGDVNHQQKLGDTSTGMHSVTHTTDRSPADQTTGLGVLVSEANEGSSELASDGG